VAFRKKYDPTAPPPTYGRVRVNWLMLILILAVLVVLAITSNPILIGVGLIVLLLVIVNKTGTGNWIPGGIGDDTNAAIPERRDGPPDY
jgi:hypothetical protein